MHHLHISFPFRTPAGTAAPSHGPEPVRPLHSFADFLMASCTIVSHVHQVKVRPHAAHGLTGQAGRRLGCRLPAALLPPTKAGADAT